MDEHNEIFIIFVGRKQINEKRNEEINHSSRHDGIGDKCLQ